MNIIEELKKLFFSEKNDKLLRNIAILGMIGVVLLFVGNIFSVPSSPAERVNKPENGDSINIEQNYVDRIRDELVSVISVIRGVGNVEVKIYVSEGSYYEYEYNISENNKITNETDQNDGSRRIEEESYDRETVIIRDSSGNERPVIRREVKPEIKGILIVAEGAEISSLKYDIFRAVQGLLDLPAHKINVLPYQRG